MSFKQKLQKIVQKNNSLLCIGLDPDLEKLPKHLLNNKDPIFEFNKAIIDATSDLVCTYKPNIAFYEAYGIEGLKSLKKTLEYLKKNYPEIPTILDAKRGDIGSTNLAYGKAYFEELGVDAMTVHPYLGKEALKPLLDYKDKGIIVLVKTSNPGAGEFQDLEVGGIPLYKVVAKNIVESWNENNNCCIVVGATYPDELREIRKIVGDMPILVPGIGAQGGDVEKTVKAGKDSKGEGIIISSSRGIIFASDGEDFAEAARKEAEKLKKEINKFR